MPMELTPDATTVPTKPAKKPQSPLRQKIGDLEALVNQHVRGYVQPGTNLENEAARTAMHEFGTAITRAATAIKVTANAARAMGGGEAMQHVKDILDEIIAEATQLKAQL